MSEQCEHDEHADVEECELCKQYAAENDKLRQRVAELEGQRCEHCGYAAIYSGPPNCPYCGAPNCCQHCCQKQRADDLRQKLEAAERERDEAKWALNLATKRCVEHFIWLRDDSELWEAARLYSKANGNTASMFSGLVELRWKVTSLLVERDTLAAKLERIEQRKTAFGPAVVPDSLKELHASQTDAGRDLRILVEDRRVTDLSADHWMAQARDSERKLETMRAALGQTNRPKIVCICGSSRFVDVAAVKAWEFEKLGVLALSMHLLPQWYEGVKADHQAEHENVAHILDALHLRKIDMADEVFVVNVGGYIGERTRTEINYAEQSGKPVIYLEPARAALEGEGR